MASVRDFLLPDLGEGLTEGEIVSWLVAVGDRVAVDQPVAEIETAKAVVEVPSPFAGTVTALHGEIGDEVAVGAPLLSVTEAPTGADADSEGAAATQARGSQAGDSPAGVDVTDIVPPAPRGDPADGASGNVLVGYGTDAGGRSRRRRGGGKQPAAGRAGARSATPRSSRPLAKPPVRLLARDRGIDLALVQGTGPDGSITRADVEAHPGMGASTQPADAATQNRSPGDQLDAAPPGGERRIPLRGVRKLIAEKMTVSRREIPEATSWVDVDASALWELREALNREQPDVRVSPLAIILRATVTAIRRFPQVNARLDIQANEIVVGESVHLGFAAQTDRGLVVPVIRDADRRSTLEIATELNRLGAAARDGKLTPAELTGGTFSVSNYGSFGVDGGSPVINHPEAAILGVGRISDRPWVVDGELTVRKVLQLSIAFDHRICDGAEAAGFLRLVGDYVESPPKLFAAL